MAFQIVKLLGSPVEIKMLFQGAYAAGTTYNYGEGVSYNGSSYVCILTTTGNLPTDTTYWSLIASKGDTGATGPTGATGAAGAGFPTGGATGKVLMKASAADYDTTWGDAASTLDGLTDVTITTPATDEVLKYNGSAWVNGTGGGSVSFGIINAVNSGIINQ